MVFFFQALEAQFRLSDEADPMVFLFVDVRNAFVNVWPVTIWCNFFCHLSLLLSEYWQVISGAFIAILVLCVASEMAKFSHICVPKVSFKVSPLALSLFSLGLHLRLEKVESLQRTFGDRSGACLPSG